MTEERLRTEATEELRTICAYPVRNYNEKEPSMLARAYAEGGDRALSVVGIRYSVGDGLLTLIGNPYERVRGDSAELAKATTKKLRGLGASDAVIQERLNQAASLEVAQVSTELVELLVKIASAQIVTESDIEMLRRGVVT